MSDQLRVLLVEDNPDDAELIRLTLSRGSAPVSMTRVEEAEALREALAREPWDVVVADYRLPRFSAPAALAVVQESGLDLPFIVVSGTIGEETAVAMMRAGTHDYLMKDNLSRLLPAIEHEMANARERQAHRDSQTALQASLEQYRSLYSAISGGVIVEAADGTIIEANDVASAILGRSIEEMDGHLADDIAWQTIHEDGTPFPRDEHPTAVTLRTGQPVHDVVLGLPHPRTGVLTWILVSSEPILAPTTGEVIAAVATFTDITARKQAEDEVRQSEQRFRAIFDSSAVGIAVTGAPRQHLDCNGALLEMLGLTRAEFLAMDADEFTHPEDRHPDQTPWQELVAGQRSSYQRETRFLHEDGHVVWVRLTVSLGAYGASGELAAITVVEDIGERKRADDRLRDSEEQYRQMFENTSSGVAVYEAVDEGQDFVLRDFNSAGERVEGVNRAEVLGRSVCEVFPGVTEMGLLDVFRRVWETGQAEYLPPTFYRDERHSGWKENFVYRLPAGQVVAMYDDVTERVQAQHALYETSERLGAVIDAAPVAVIMLDSQGTVSLWNPAAEHIFGWAEDEVLGGPFPGATHGDGELFTAMVRRVMEEGSFTDLQVRIPRKDGVAIDVSISAGPVHDAEGNVIAAMGVLADITERTKAARTLQASEERFRRVYEEAPVPYQSLDESGHLLAANPSWLNALGYARDEVIGRHFDEFLAPEDRPLFAERFPRLKKYGTASEVEFNMVRRDGSRLVVQFEARVVRNPDGSFKQTHCVFQDITARRQAEAALAAETERLAVTLRSIGECVIATDTEGRISLINSAAEALTGWTEAEALGTHVDEVLHLADQRTGHRLDSPIRDVLAAQTTLELPNRTLLVSREGREHSVAASGAPIWDMDGHTVGAVLVFRDVTEELQLRTEALKAQKLESLGVLAGGIAHDFNNALLVINGNLQMARMFPHGEPKHGELLHNAERACVQARDLTQQLLTFAKGGAPIKEVATIGALVRDTALFAVSGSNARCEFDIVADAWPVEVDLGQISQVVNNLVINADQAMPAGGLMRVRVHNVTLDETAAVPLPAGDYVCVSVADNGIGIPREHLDRIFDPYFTTKSKGSGLGLASCYSIVSRHGGHLAVTSELGAGSTFSMYLPISDSQAGAQRAGDQAVPTGSGRILVMDDEEAVRELAGMLLEDLGYCVEMAADGTEAVAQYRAAMEAGQPFVAVVLDLTIRGAMGGLETIAALSALDPDVRAVVCSGYSADPVMAQYEQHGFRAVVVKPYDIAELAQAVARAIAPA